MEVLNDCFGTHSPSSICHRQVFFFAIPV